MIETIIQLLVDTFRYVITSISHNALVLLLGIAVAAAVRIYVSPERMRAAFAGKAAASVPASVLFGAFTPFCACGTMAVVLSMCASMLPWGPVMAFLVSSPLMSPDGFVFMGGILGFRFAMALAVASVVMGLAAGFLADLIAKRTNWLKDQLRSAPLRAEIEDHAERESACGCGQPEVLTASATGCGCGHAAVLNASATGCGCGQPAVLTASAPACGCGKEETRNRSGQDCGCEPEEILTAACSCQTAELSVVGRSPITEVVRRLMRRYRLDEWMQVIVDLGLKQILPMFMLFAGIGYLVNRFIPTEWIQVLFGADRWYSIPLAAIIGLPMYVSGDGSIPLIRSLLDSGAGPGALMAFMITGPGTSAGVIAGIATILRRRAVALYIALILFGGMICGFLYSLL